MPFADINSIRLNYSSEGSGMPVIMITGFGGRIEFWKKASDILSERYNVICVDNRGAGLTEYDGPFTMDDLGDDIVGLIKHLGLPKAHIVGWSMGSHIAQNVAIRYPEMVATLTLIASYRFRPARSMYILDAMVEATENGAPSEYLSKILNGLCYSESFFKFREETGSLPRLSNLDEVKGLRAQLNAVDSYNTAESASKIRCPTLYVHGTKDIMVDCEEGFALAGLIRNCKILRIEGAAHSINPNLYLKEMTEHIDGHPF